ncbi:hypothetical protein VTJ04DRAFT_3210 [Mycothermus thermophilus]|uniref:uncharacterized protein n=1 Tax=Humicola insolens TaxID=85995 RepID=UPI0037449ECA
MEIFSTAPRLDNEDDWPRWIAYIQRVSEDLGIWYLVDPDADDDLVERLLEATRPPTGEIAIKETRLAPVLKKLTGEEVQARLRALREQFEEVYGTDWVAERKALSNVYQLIHHTTARYFMEFTLISLEEEGLESGFSLHQFIKTLRRFVAPPWRVRARYGPGQQGV